MKSYVCLGFILLLAAPLYAETYSWVDDSGTYNFTEDYSSVPRKYRKKVRRREDIQQEVPSVSPDSENTSGTTGKTETKPAVTQGTDKGLYGGKSRDDWRKELDALEAELKGIEQHMEQVRRQIYDTKEISREQLGELKKEYEDSRVAYNQKYKEYTELIETIRKAGIQVDIKNKD
ncbi:MAG: DUF4124 domain-containing protein [Desulfuromonadaceae bacterium]|nr:DUF4124 domain-containing protein [Desulfuromonadaceae bacterium]MDD2848817.1 DUF4124 domain-containing protein [Desulfuromonadaceae bacterium]MDD4130467.1 DUF4124 domain-containing protein [Desulfuromonadaceae bacterium]